MKRLLRLVLILIVVVWSGGTTLAQDLNAIMWQEGILFGRFSVCFADNSNVDRNLGRTFTDAYIHWYQVNNPRIDMKVPVSMFANGLHAGAAEQQKLGAEGCDAVHQRISHIGQVIGVRIPDVSRQPQAQSNHPSASAVPATAPILLWHSNTGWVQGMCSYQLTFDGQGVFFESATGIEQLSLSVDVFDAQGNRLASDTLHTEPFADSDATRTTVSYWEGDCEAKRIVIWKAEAVIDGETVDLLKTNRLKIEDSPLKEAVELAIKQ